MRSYMASGRAIPSIMALLAAGLLLGCGQDEPSTTETATPRIANAEGTSGDLTVLAPHVLKKALDEINIAFEAEYPDTKIDLQVGMVDEMPAKIADGEMTGDVLVMPDGPELDPITDAGVIDPAEATPVATSDVIIAVPRGNPAGVRSMTDLLDADVASITIPNPDTDATGKAFKEAAVRVGIWEELEGKIEVASSPHGACTKVEDGESDAGVTYTPCVLFGHSKSTLVLGAFVPKDATDPVTMLAMALGDSDNPAAEAYVEFVATGRAQQIWGKYGFVPHDAADPTAAETSLLVPCGAGLQPACDAIADVYYQRTGVRIDFSYAGAGMLLSQLNFTRHGDLYMPGEVFWMEMAEERGLVGDYETVCCFLPVIAVQKGNPKGIESVEDLAAPDVKVAVGDPEALAVGPVTQRILERAGVRDQVMANVVMQAGCIPELANAISMNAADACIIWGAVAKQHEKHCEAIPIPVELNEVADVPIAVLDFAQEPEEAAKFMKFITSHEVAAIFAEHGFLTERPEGVSGPPRGE